jgi:hypothetical protein
LEAFTVFSKTSKNALPLSTLVPKMLTPEHKET